MENAFRVGVTSDILDSRGEPAFGREPLKALEGLQWEWLPRGLKEISADHAAAFDALYVNSPRVPAAAVARPELRLKLISRHGVGYDSVDVDAMTRAGVLVANTPNAVPRPVATIALTFVLALAHRLMAKDRITRAGRWAERLEHMGTGLTGRTLGVVGAGRLARMKPTAYLINVARGPIVNEKALYETLAARRIAGAGLDVFEEEPTPADNPILKLDNVIVSPHALCWTDELFGNIARTAIGAVVAVHAGRRPDFIVNPGALIHPRTKAWLKA
jgi:phosphoglycerate dehydrogenase-like enzyme